MTANAEPLALVDGIVRRREPVWFAMSTALLEGNTATQRKFVRFSRNLGELTCQEGRRHTMALCTETRRNNSYLLIWMMQADRESAEAARTRLAEYASAKKHQLQLARSFGMLFDSESDRVVATTFDNPPPGPDAALDELIKRLGLKGIEAFGQLAPSRPKPRPRRAGK